MNGIKRFFISRSIKSKLTQQAKSHRLQAFSEMKKLLLLTAVSLEEVQKTIRWVSQTYSYLQEIVILNLTNESERFRHEYHQILLQSYSVKDFSFFGKPNEYVLSLLETSPKDLLLNTCQERNVYIEWMTAHCIADVKVGAREEMTVAPYSISIYQDKLLSITDCLIQTETYLNALAGKSN